MLTTAHQGVLRTRGVPLDFAEAAGVYSADEPSVKAILGFGGCGTGLVLRYGPDFARVRIDAPGPDGKHYRQPRGAASRLYTQGLREATDSILADPTVPLYLTEGELKALAANAAGFPTIAVAGVWSWKTKLHGQSLDIADLDRVEWRRRRVILVFDDDAELKPPVAWAEHALAQTLQARGAEVFVIRLPLGADKLGWDDYLVRHGAEAFKGLTMAPLHQADADDLPTFWRVADLAEAYLHDVQVPEHRIKTGIADLDAIVRGLAKGEVFTILGRSGVGKTAFMLNLMSNMSAGGTVPILGFSLEQPGTELFERMVSLGTGWAGSEIEQRARLRDSALMDAIQATADRWASVVVVDKPCSLTQVDRMIQESQRRGLWASPLRTVFIDYLGMISPERSGKAYEIVSETSREIKRIAKRQRVGVVLLCQIGREGQSGGTPVKMSDARDSGVVEESSDYVLGIWRPELDESMPSDKRAEYAGVLMAKVLKNRGGPAPRQVKLAWEASTLRVKGAA